ncbi:hypothetical protein GCM10025770_11520 [Viridibacterium curvum]|uniref:MoxR-vWA-beta-propeller ternary system domain-containing protein n=2 Tax=Viridibacterium curvum TaxID=1101404 RepID=A0ABP9QH59_9RHOO
MLAWGDAALRLHLRLQEMDEVRLARLALTASRDVLIVTGAVDDLPWSEGVGYFASCPEVPALCMPTTLAADVPADLLFNALSSMHARVPLLLWPDPRAILPLDRLLPGSPALLARIHANWQSVGAQA